jgi:hypothetical protein
MKAWIEQDEHGFVEYIKKMQPVEPNSAEWNELFG